jgi:hypothetical protein
MNEETVAAKVRGTLGLGFGNEGQSSPAHCNPEPTHDATTSV